MSSHSQASERDIESSQAPERHIWSSPSQDPERDVESFQTPEQDIRSSQVPEHPRKDYPPNQQDEVHQAYIKFGPYQLIPLSEAPTSTQNDSGEFSSAIRDRPFVGNSSVTVTHFNLTFEAPLEVVVTLKEGVLDPAKVEVLDNDDLTSKGQIAGGKVCVGRNGRKLNKRKRDRGSHFKMSSSSRVPLSKSVSNMVELISS
ncbi:hypothetical protein Gohar_013814 [Gossypium harknessii]|uniref:Uncharacterized protein n=1 Tax=Gossypium harknessii TaxID=34285 RepID=A0A7J9H2P3_9ROSI|nr:hypothetical protein [Gossypium harknessii]